MMTAKTRSLLSLIVIIACLVFASLACRQGNGGGLVQPSTQPSPTTASPVVAPTNTQEIEPAQPTPTDTQVTQAEQPTATSTPVPNQDTPTVQVGAQTSTPDAALDDLDKLLATLNADNQAGDALNDLP